MKLQNKSYTCIPVLLSDLLFKCFTILYVLFEHGFFCKNFLSGFFCPKLEKQMCNLKQTKACFRYGISKNHTTLYVTDTGNHVCHFVKIFDYHPLGQQPEFIIRVHNSEGRGLGGRFRSPTGSRQAKGTSSLGNSEV